MLFIYFFFLSIFNIEKSKLRLIFSGIIVWRVERVIILFCYFSCKSKSIYILVFNIFVTFTTLILPF